MNVLQPTRVHPGKGFHIGIDIQGQTVKAYPPADSNTDAAQLVPVQPNAPIGRLGTGIDSPMGSRSDHGFFHAGNKFDHLDAPSLEVHDGVGNQLPRSVIGDVTSPVGRHHGYAFLGQKSLADTQVFTAALPSQCKDSGMFDAKDDIRKDSVGNFGIYNGQLKVQDALVSDLRQVYLPVIFNIFLFYHRRNSKILKDLPY